MQSPPIDNISRQGLSEAVRERLMRLVLSQHLKPGDALPSEGDLAERFGVSRPTVREALRQLVAIGAVEVAHGKLPTVGSPSSEPLKSFFRFAVGNTENGLREAIELRRKLETEIAALAAERATDQSAQELVDALGRMEQAVGTTDPWVNADVTFHVVLARSAGNSLMIYLVEALGGLVSETIRLLHLQRGVDNVAPTLERHRRIVKAVIARDPDAARAAMQAHFAATEPFLYNTIGVTETGVTNLD